MISWIRFFLRFWSWNLQSLRRSAKYWEATGILMAPSKASDAKSPRCLSGRSCRIKQATLMRQWHHSGITVASQRLHGLNFSWFRSSVLCFIQLLVPAILSQYVTITMLAMSSLKSWSLSQPIRAYCFRPVASTVRPSCSPVELWHSLPPKNTVSQSADICYDLCHSVSLKGMDLQNSIRVPYVSFVFPKKVDGLAVERSMPGIQLQHVGESIRSRCSLSSSIDLTGITNRSNIYVTYIIHT